MTEEKKKGIHIDTYMTKKVVLMVLMNESSISLPIYYL
jgi:hypothetical protein